MTPAWCGDACVPAGRLPALVQLRQAACIRTRAPGWGCRVQGSGEVVPGRRNMITVHFKKKEVQKNLTSRVSHLKQCRSGYLALQYLSKGKAAYLRSCFRIGSDSRKIGGVMAPIQLVISHMNSGICSSCCRLGLAGIGALS